MQKQNIDRTSPARKLHETTLVPLVLSLLGGYLDSYTYILKDGVFANAQTGNIVLLSISMVSGNFTVIEKYLFPILTFALGILGSEYVKTVGILKPRHRRVKLVLLTEALILLAIGLLPPVSTNLATTSMISFLAAIQVSNFNKILGSRIATTMITGNLKSSMENLHLFVHYKDKEAGMKVANYFLIILSFCIGASLGMIIVRAFKENSIYFCLIPITIAYVSILVRERRLKESKSI